MLSAEKLLNIIDERLYYKVKKVHFVLRVNFMVKPNEQLVTVS